MVTAAQCRMARAGLLWKISDVAERSGVSRNTINRFELGHVSPNPATLTVLRQMFEAAGIEFLDGDAPGVRLRPKP